MSLLLSPPHSTHKTSSKFLPATKSGTSSALRCILAALQILRGHLSVRTLSLSQAVLVPSPPGRHHHLPHTMRPAPGAGKPHGLFSRSVKAQKTPSPLPIHHSSAHSATKRFPQQSLPGTPEAWRLRKSRHSTSTISLPTGTAYCPTHWGEE